MARACGQDGPWLDPDALRQWQLHAIRKACRHAMRSRFYRKLFAGRFRDEGWPEDFAAFAAAPFTRPEDLRAGWRDFLCVGLGEVSRMVSLDTSGTTSSPKRIAFGDADLEGIIAYFAAGIAGMVDAGDVVLILLPGADRPAGVANLLGQALERLGAYGVTGAPAVVPDTFLDELARRRPRRLVATPSQLRALLADESLRGPLRANIDAVLSCTAPLPPALKEGVEREWDARVVEYYGMTESGYGGGVECHARNGYHLNETDLYFEVVDPVSGSPVSDGQAGEVVFTTLRRRAMPLIRYRTGDYAAMLPGPCGCGSRMRRLGPVMGRIERRDGGIEIVDVEKGAYSARHLDGNL